MRRGLKRLLGRVTYRRPLSVLTLVGLDALALACGVYLAAYLSGDRAVGADEALPLLLALGIAIFSAHGLYDRAGRRRNPGAVLAAALWWTGLIAVGVAVYPGAGYTLAAALLAGALALAVSAGLRLSYEQGVEWVYRRGLGLVPTLVVGDDRERSRVCRMLERSPGAYYTAGELPVGKGREGSPSLSVPDLREALDRTGARHVIVAGAGRIPDDELLEALRSVRLRGIRMRLAPGAVGLMRGGPVPPDGTGLPLVEVVYPELDNTQRTLKRALDVSVSALALVLLSPVFAAVALAIKLDSPGPAFFRQKRVGADEEVFLCYKFRSMYQDAEARQGELEDRNEAGGAIFKLREDPRVTPVGDFLRRRSIDELPQLINVLLGEMSLVGPRPLPLRDFWNMDEPHKRRLAARPGLTGYWQTSGRSDLSFEDMVRLDLYYIENWSLSLDVKLILKTLGTVALRRDAY